MIKKEITAGLFLAFLLSAAAAVPSAAGEASKQAGAYGPAWEIMNHAEDGETVAAEDGVPSSNGTLISVQEVPAAGGTAYSGDVNTLKTAKEAGSLILAVGIPGKPAESTVSYYEKDEDGMLQQVFSVPAVSGLNGITADKKEGDKKTPQGVYSFTMAFGMKEDPGSILPYHKVAGGDYFVDDSSSRFYNRLVNENEVVRDWNSGENLIRQAPHYNYALVLNYNADYVPDQGSAIFLHCPKISNNTGTSGCISVPEEYARELVRRVDKNTRIIVVPEEKELAKY